MVFGCGVRKAISEVELRGMTASFSITRNRGERRLSFLRGNWDQFDPSHLEARSTLSAHLEDFNRFVLALGIVSGTEQSFRAPLEDNTRTGAGLADGG